MFNDTGVFTGTGEQGDQYGGDVGAAQAAAPGPRTRWGSHGPAGLHQGEHRYQVQDLLPWTPEPLHLQGNTHARKHMSRTIPVYFNHIDNHIVYFYMHISIYCLYFYIGVY